MSGSKFADLKTITRSFFAGVIANSDLLALTVFTVCFPKIARIVPRALRVINSLKIRRNSNFNSQEF